MGKHPVTPSKEPSTLREPLLPLLLIMLALSGAAVSAFL